MTTGPGDPAAAGGASVVPETLPWALPSALPVTLPVPETAEGVLVVVALVLLTAVAAVRLSSRTGLPSLLLYLGLGVLLGEDVLGVEFDDEELTQAIGYTALALILAEGGLTTRWAAIKDQLGPAASLATLGTVVSFLVTGLGAWLVLDVDLLTGLLLGAVVASTDSAAVFSVLRSVRLPRRLVGILEAESGLNDAPAVLAVLALTAAAAGRSDDPWWVSALLAVLSLAVGVGVGLGVARLGAALLRRLAAPASGPFPLAVFAVLAVAYGGATLLGGSGFISVYVAALVLGNARLPHGGATRGFATSLGWFAQIGLFVLLGLLATPSRLPEAIGPALLITAVLVLLARPASVVVSTVWFRVPWRDQAFLSWAGLRGAVPIVLATIPILEGVTGSRRIFDVVFVVVVVSVLLQAPTLPWLARRLGLQEDEATDMDVESTPLGRMGADLLEVQVHERSRLHGVTVQELRLPKPAHVSLVVRPDGALVPTPTTVLRRGDAVLVVTTPAIRETVERRIRAVSEGGRLAGWGEPGGTDGRRRPG
ncbi:potassium/proton antiporter [Aquipuribacter nitratireducens]|uniref:Potassium/proton antiporter n=1 Tax=Aquipuribacter nitratireducens TaxID=650104 RepID=A0ABW0GPG3_9MICO